MQSTECIINDTVDNEGNTGYLSDSHFCWKKEAIIREGWPLPFVTVSVHPPF